MSDPNPTTGLGVAAAVALSGTGVVQTRTPVAGTRGVAQYTVNVPLGGSVVVTSSAIDDAGATVGSSGGGLDSHLGTAKFFAILGASAVTGSTGAGSTVSGGNIGIFPNNQSSVTNFPPSTLTAPGVFHYADSTASQAQIDLAAAIVFFQGLTPTLSGLSNLSTGGNGVNNHTYTAGNYFGATSLDIPTSITLDAQGNPNAVFVFVAGSTITLESGASVILANGALAQNVYWVNGTSFTSVFAVTSNMVGTILAHTTITLGGGTLAGRALANTGAVTLSTTEVITTTSATAGQSGWNAIVLNSVPQSSNPAWYRPSNAGKYSNTFYAPVSVDDTDSNPWTVRGRVAGQCVVEFQIPTFLNTTGTLLTDVNTVMDETPIDSISAELIVTVTGGTS
jgi:Ice-binding-like